MTQDLMGAVRRAAADLKEQRVSDALIVLPAGVPDVGQADTVSASDPVTTVRAAADAGYSMVVLLEVGYFEGDHDVVVVSDHINLTGTNPLAGPNVAAWGVRFPDMTEPYDPVLRKSLAGLGPEGIAAGLPGNVGHKDLPRAAGLGADAVTAGLVHAVIAARHRGLRVAGVLIRPDMDAGAIARQIARLI